MQIMHTGRVYAPLVLSFHVQDPFPLIVAAQRGYTEATKTLIASESDVNIQNKVRNHEIRPCRLRNFSFEMVCTAKLYRVTMYACAA